MERQQFILIIILWFKIFFMAVYVFCGCMWLENMVDSLHFLPSKIWHVNEYYLNFVFIQHVNNISNKRVRSRNIVNIPNLKRFISFGSSYLDFADFYISFPLFCSVYLWLCWALLNDINFMNICNPIQSISIDITHKFIDILVSSSVNTW